MKMFRYLFRYTAAVILCFVFVTCRRADLPALTPTPQPGPELTGPNTVIITGRVLDESGSPVIGALITAGEKTTLSVGDGYFSLESAHVKADAFIIAEKSGYFQGSRMVTTKTDGSYDLVIRMPRKTVSGSFDAAAGGTINTTSGGSIAFPAGAVVSANGSAYTGSVQVATYVYNPTSPFFQEVMPGDLRGVRTSGDSSLMQSYGMMAVELTGSGGEKLQLAAGKPASIKFPVPTALRPGAPASIPLWYFDEHTGFWKEEGSATFNGTQYQGSVNHFSFWNCDVPLQAVLFEASFAAGNNTAIPRLKVELRGTGPDTALLRNGFTDGNGYVAGLIPANKQLRMTVTDPCGTVVHTALVGPYATATSIGTITLPNFSFAGSYIISGTVTTCNGPLQRGTVQFSFPTSASSISQYSATVINGAYRIVITPCNRTFIAPITAYAYDSLITTRTLKDTIQPQLGVPMVKNYSMCVPYATVGLKMLNNSYGTFNYRFIAPPDLATATYNSATGVLTGYAKSAYGASELRFEVAAAPGTITPNLNNGSHASSFRYVWETNGTSRVLLLTDSAGIHFDRYGPAGDFVSGSYWAYLKDSLFPTSRFYISGNLFLRRN